MSATDGSDSEYPQHELQTFFLQDLEMMRSEYERIFARTTEDPGTAGDEGEANWASFLQAWLPQGYRVVTKGRLLAPDGRASPQVDVIVLRPGYPQRLLDKKVYLVDGVAAVFESKTTLKASHVTEAAFTAATIRGLSVVRAGTPYREIVTPPIFGILAHSHSWKGANSTPQLNISKVLEAAHSVASHPSHLIDLLCVADLALWDLHRTTYLGPPLMPQKRVEDQGWPIGGATLTAYVRVDEAIDPLALGGLVTSILHRVGVEDPVARPLADYFRLAGMVATGSGPIRAWPSDQIFTTQTLSALRRGEVTLNEWGEWAHRIPLYRFYDPQN